MRHKGIDRDMTRQKITESVSRGFRKFGFAGVGVDALAKGAGVTSGAFYAHFGSKNKAFELALTLGLDEVLSNLPTFYQHGEKWLEAFIDYYLSQPHLDDQECGCAMASLTSEVVRGPLEMHAIYENKMQQIAEQIALGLSGENTHQRAWSVLSLLIGAVNVLRAMSNPELINRLAQEFRQSALCTAGPVKARV